MPSYHAFPRVAGAELPEPGETVTATLRSPLTASVSQMETFAACPFKHFATYGLRLEPAKSGCHVDRSRQCLPPDSRAADQADARRAGGWEWSKLENSDEIIRTLADDIGKELRATSCSQRSGISTCSIGSRRCSGCYRAQAAANKRGKFTPWKAELEFGDRKELPALQLKTPGATSSKLRGKIDRVDILEDQALFAVIDYKYRGETLALDHVEHGLSLQLLTYLVVIAKNGQTLAGKRLTPAAALYVKLLSQLDTVKHPGDSTDPADPKFHLQTKPRGIVNCSIASLRHRLAIEGSDVLQLYVTPRTRSATSAIPTEPRPPTSPRC